MDVLRLATSFVTCLHAKDDAEKAAADIEALAEEVNGKRQLTSKPPVLERGEDEAIRQGFSIETAKYPTIETYADLCAHTLARAHARSGDTDAIAAGELEAADTEDA